MTPAPPPCPICRRPAQARFRPFCSARCAQVDLGRWLGGGYTIPGADGDAIAREDDDAQEIAPRR